MAGSKVTGGPRFGTGCWQPRLADRLLMVLRFTLEGGLIRGDRGHRRPRSCPV